MFMTATGSPDWLSRSAGSVLWPKRYRHPGSSRSFMPHDSESQAKENNELNAIRLQQLHPEFKKEWGTSVKDTDVGMSLTELESFPGHSLHA